MLHVKGLWKFLDFRGFWVKPGLRSGVLEVFRAYVGVYRDYAPAI